MLEEQGRHLFHGFGECGGEQQHLTIRAHVAQYAHDLRFKAEVEHTVGLVNDDEGDAAQVGHAPGVGCKHVDHAAGGAHHNVRATLELRDL
jgi:hypothetical protein